MGIRTENRLKIFYYFALSTLKFVLVPILELMAQNSEEWTQNYEPPSIPDFVIERREVGGQASPKLRTGRIWTPVLLHIATYMRDQVRVLISAVLGVGEGDPANKPASLKTGADDTKPWCLLYIIVGSSSVAATPLILAIVTIALIYLSWFSLPLYLKIISLNFLPNAFDDHAFQNQSLFRRTLFES